jgi:RIO kinase 1
MGTLARLGLAHGDLSAYNLLVHDGKLIIIDTPQVVDVIANPRGADFLDRDASNVASWFTARHLPAIGGVPRPDELAAFVRAEAGLR